MKFSRGNVIKNKETGELFTIGNETESGLFLVTGYTKDNENGVPTYVTKLLSGEVLEEEYTLNQCECCGGGFCNHSDGGPIYPNIRVHCGLCKSEKMGLIEDMADEEINQEEIIIDKN